ncbi:MAG: O-antigen ligase family protein [Planctomycetota bacterium]
MKQTRLGLFCEKLIEAGWLAALIIAPLFLNFHSTSVVEIDKSSLIRSLALVMLVAYLIKLLETGKSLPGKPQTTTSSRLGRDSTIASSVFRQPLTVCCLLMGLVYLFTSIISVTPNISWWGDDARGQGSYTLISYVLIFFITLRSLKTTEQVKRIITVVILASLPAALYGLSQLKWFGLGVLDPLRWDANFSDRIGSFMGNPIFFGAYLVMVIPLTTAQIIITASQKDNLVNKIILIVCYSIILLLQLICLLLTQSRGPILGLLAGMFFFIICYLIIRKQRTLVLLSYGLAVGLVLFLIILNLPITTGPIAQLKKIKYLDRFSTMFEGRDSGKVRLLIWEGIINMIKDNSGRAMIGYGPETLFAPFQKYTPPELVRFEHRTAHPDRSHNEFFDTLVTTGFIGLSIYLAIFWFIIFYCLRWLNLLKEKKQQLLFIICSFGGILAGFVAPLILTGSFIFTGPAVPLGLMSGAALYLFIFTLRRTGYYDETCPEFNFGKQIAQNEFSVIIIALLAACLGHFAETQLSFGLTPTRTYFWLFTAVLIFTGARLLQSQPIAEQDNQDKKTTEPVTTFSSGKCYLYFYSAITALVMSVLLYNFVTGLKIPDPNRAGVSLDFFSVLADNLAASMKPAHLLFYLLMFSGWLLTGIIIASVPSATPRARNFFNYLSIYAVVSLIAFLLYFVLHTVFLFEPVWNPPPDSAHLIKTLAPVGTNAPSIFYLLKPPGSAVIIVFHLWLLLGLIFVALMIPAGKKTARAHSDRKRDERSEKLPLLRSGNIPFIMVLGGLTTLFIVKTNLNPLRASPVLKNAGAFENIKLWDEALKRYESVLDLTWNHTYYYASLGRVYQEKYFGEPDHKKRALYLEKSRDYLLKSLSFSPLEQKRNANLGRFYRMLAQNTSNLSERAAKLKEAADYYERVYQLSPYDPELVNEWGSTYYEMQNYQKALEIYRISLAADKNFVETLAHLGEVYLVLNNPDEALKHYEKAGLLYFTGLELLRDFHQIALFVRTNEILLKHRPEYYRDEKNRQMCLYLSRNTRPNAPPELQVRLDLIIKQLEQK